MSTSPDEVPSHDAAYTSLRGRQHPAPNAIARWPGRIVRHASIPRRESFSGLLLEEQHPPPTFTRCPPPTADGVGDPVPGHGGPPGLGPVRCGNCPRIPSSGRRVRPVPGRPSPTTASSTASTSWCSTGTRRVPPELLRRLQRQRGDRHPRRTDPPLPHLGIERPPATSLRRHQPRRSCFSPGTPGDPDAGGCSDASCCSVVCDADPACCSWSGTPTA